MRVCVVENLYDRTNKFADSLNSPFGRIFHGVSLRSRIDPFPAGYCEGRKGDRLRHMSKPRKLELIGI